HRRCDLADAATDTGDGLLREDHIAIFVTARDGDLADRVEERKDFSRRDDGIIEVARRHLDVVGACGIGTGEVGDATGDPGCNPKRTDIIRDTWLLHLDRERDGAYITFPGSDPREGLLHIEPLAILRGLPHDELAIPT